VTTLALGLACLWSESRKTLLVEADPNGGCLAARLSLAQEPGLSTLAAAGRHEISMRVIAQNLQPGPGHTSVLLAPSSPHHARAALRTLSGRLDTALVDLATQDDMAVLADLGRLDAESPVLGLGEAAHRLIFVARPTLDGIDALGVRLDELSQLRSRSLVVTAGVGPYGHRELHEVLGVPVAGHIPPDPAGLASIWSASGVSTIRRRLLWRVLAGIAACCEIDTTDDETVGAPRPSKRPHLLPRSTKRQGAIR
jgi:Mrp family chromosome partitioning ATPase